MFDTDLFNLYHFVEVNKMIELGKSAKRKVLDYELSRYACYLIVQNADLNKEDVKLEDVDEIIEIKSDRRKPSNEGISA